MSKSKSQQPSVPLLSSANWQIQRRDCQPPECANSTSPVWSRWQIMDQKYGGKARHTWPTNFNFSRTPPPGQFWVPSAPHQLPPLMQKPVSFQPTSALITTKPDSPLGSSSSLTPARLSKGYRTPFPEMELRCPRK